MYANNLGHKYSAVKRDEAAQSSTSAAAGSGAPLSEEKIYSTSEGPVVITTHGKFVFVSESFPLDLARALTARILDVQGSGEMKMAGTQLVPQVSLLKPGSRVPELTSETGEPLTAGLVRFFSNCGVMKAVADAAARAAR
jgi:hypothetical protein